MVKKAKIVAVGLVATGIAEIAFRGADAALYAWYLVFALWMVALFARFALAAVDAYKTVFAKGPDGEMTFPEFEQKMASFSRGSDEEATGASNKATSGNGSDGGTEGFFDDDRINQIYRADDPFGEFLDS
ncbi:hypothetical protein SAMN04487869_1315 [Marinobacter sp. DSM 26671]|uniref:hypothetical protein n=1 Tax=Marinobacter sp. DSM 26671 TaxID=1761793 RepID=UPI0008ED7C08|nr:hypothetical protein [Marinobacter sp. DSM 26671]SFE97402.1 hypothetical protein SAMN04487869_1315 [Marinobacter sp. DSM 26671]